MNSEVLVRVEMLARAEMEMSRKCILVVVKGKADAEILAQKLERPDWVIHACHAEAEEDRVNQILRLPPDAEGHVIVGTSFVEAAITVSATSTAPRMATCARSYEGDHASRKAHPQRVTSMTKAQELRPGI